MSGSLQLTQEQRYQIRALMETSQNRTQMATVLSVRKAPISRELPRHRGHHGYRPCQAPRLAQARQANTRRPRLSLTIWTQVDEFLGQA